MLTFLILFFIVGLVFINEKADNNFEFKTIKSNCSSFNISGSIAYNSSKSSIYISNVSYCGLEDKEKYTSISCTLYEKNNDTVTKIDSCNYKEKDEILLEDFLKQISFNIDNYLKVCKTFKEDTLYLEIEANNDSEKVSTYKIPLKLESNCNK